MERQGAGGGAVTGDANSAVEAVEAVETVDLDDERLDGLLGLGVFEHAWEGEEEEGGKEWNEERERARLENPLQDSN
jgi:hypothetical protein